MEHSNNISTLISIVVGIKAIISEKYRILLMGLFSLFILCYYYMVIYGYACKNKELIDKLNENIN